MSSPTPLISWIENDQEHTLRWHSESGAPAPKRVQLADDRMTADAAYKLACEGTALLWRGDFQNARQLLQAMARRIDKKPEKSAKKIKQPSSATEAFHLHRQAQSQRARVLAMVLIPFDADYTIPLRRAPDVQQACTEAYGPASSPFIASLRELLGLVGAHEWRKKGVEITALGARIHPHYGVFSPVRGEYIELVAKAPLPSSELAFDIGSGTGVLAAVLAKRGVKKIIATDQDPRALECARENLAALNLDQQVELRASDLFPEGKAPLIVCNPPWLPARPNSPIEYAVYDPDSRMLRGFLAGVAAHLEENGEAWLILSDLAEHLGLRSAAELWAWIDVGGLEVVGKMDIRPQHPKASDASDPLHTARAAEITSLWRLKLKSQKS
ncbi:MAG: class I SAM-dependent methyltransferase [Undibacterium sp.]|uniref:class I SAM-dependent methyltransferase n=1 Tax=Undibacterium sp. TaxID=1914977 RepID=UPI0027257B94|nr:class I SAM-dependent methyltransferase [Undibacterium sp.]MDO8653444.1 class I SAM-dependent methyltransferase [Undibacterium sp.]